MQVIVLPVGFLIFFISFYEGFKIFVQRGKIVAGLSLMIIGWLAGFGAGWYLIFGHEFILNSASF